MNLDRELSKKSLTDGFCLLYGEKYRVLFDTVGGELIELGIKSGKDYFTKYSLHKAHQSGLYIMVEHFEPNKIYKNVEEFKSTVIKELTPFLSNIDIKKLLVEQPYVSFNSSNFAVPIKNNIFEKISNGLKNIKPTPVKKIPSFDYFKQFLIFDSCKKSINLSTESGLGLDQFNYESVKYYLEEGEEFYLPKAIPFKYHQLGSTLIREELRMKMIDKIKENITKDSDRHVRGLLSGMVSSFCFDSEEDTTLLDIQTVCGEDGFLTSEQLTNRLKNY